MVAVGTAAIDDWRRVLASLLGGLCSCWISSFISSRLGSELFLLRSCFLFLPCFVGSQNVDSSWNDSYGSNHQKSPDNMEVRRLLAIPSSHSRADSSFLMPLNLNQQEDHLLVVLLML